MAVLSAALLTAVVITAFLVGHMYQFQRAYASRLRPSTAIVKSEPGLATVQGPVLTAEVQATWRLPDGIQRSGILTSATAPAIDYSGIGATVPVWLNRSGLPQPPPPGNYDTILGMVMVSVIVPSAAAVLLLGCFGVCHVALNRHRLVQWEQAWAITEPQWTSRR